MKKVRHWRLGDARRLAHECKLQLLLTMCSFHRGTRSWWRPRFPKWCRIPRQCDSKHTLLKHMIRPCQEMCGRRMKISLQFLHPNYRSGCMMYRRILGTICCRFYKLSSFQVCKRGLLTSLISFSSPSAPMVQLVWDRAIRRDEIFDIPL